MLNSSMQIGSQQQGTPQDHAVYGIGQYISFGKQQTHPRMVLAVIAIVVLVISMWIYWYNDPKRRRLAREANKLPGPTALPVIGNSLLALKFTRENFFYIINEITMTHWPRYRAWYGTIPEINFSDADDIEIVLRSSVNITKGMIYDFLHPWLGTGLLTSSGQKWHLHRKLITPTFHFKILETFQDVFTEKSRILVEKLNQEVENKSGFDVYPYITRCALDIISETAMGVELNAQDDKDSPYVTAVYEISELLAERVMRMWLYPDIIYFSTKRGKRFKRNLNILHSFSKKIISERKQKPFRRDASDKSLDVLGAKRRMAFLDLLLEAAEGGRVLSDEEIREEVDTFMFEGHDTTSASLVWTLFLLGNHPEVQERVFEEQAAIFQDSDRAPTMQDLSKMKYLEQVIKESLRLYPSVPFIMRALTEDIEVGEYNFPAGCQVTVHIYQAHRNPKYFPNPEEFNPDRFLPENVQGRHPYAYIPFSAGSRNCIGQKFALQEEKTVLSAVVRHFRVRALDRPADVKLYGELILRPQGPILVTLERR